MAFPTPGPTRNLRCCIWPEAHSAPCRSLYWKAAETITPISATNVGAVLFMISILPGFAATTYIPSLVLERVLYYRCAFILIAA